MRRNHAPRRTRLHALLPECAASPCSSAKPGAPGHATHERPAAEAWARLRRQERQEVAITRWDRTPAARTRFIGNSPQHRYVVAWVVLQISILDENVVAGCFLNAPLHSTTLASIHGLQEDAHASVAREWETFTLVDQNGGSLESGDVVFVPLERVLKFWPRKMILSFYVYHQKKYVSSKKNALQL